MFTRSTTNRFRQGAFFQSPRRDGAASLRRLVVEPLEQRRLLTVFALQEQLHADALVEGARFGHCVDMDGDLAVVGAPLAGGAHEGAVSVFARNDAGTPGVRTDDTWDLQAELAAADGQPWDLFGASVAVCAQTKTIVIGAYAEDDGGFDAGAAYVFTFEGAAWTEQQKLAAGDPAQDDRFGFSVTVDGDTIVVGAPCEDGGEMERGNAGSAYVFTRTAGTWTQQTQLTAVGVELGAEFGSSVGVAGNTIAVGAPLEDGTGSDQGAVHVFTRDDNGTPEDLTDDDWSGGHRIVSRTPGDGDQFGFSLALDDGFSMGGPPQLALMVGEPYDDNADGQNAGSADLFIGGAADWVNLVMPNPEPPPDTVEMPPFTPREPADGALFGTSVTIDAATLEMAFGAPGQPASSYTGKVYKLGMSGEQGLTAPDATPLDRFGSSVAISGDALIVGAPYEDGGAGDVADAGSAYVYGPAPPKDFGDAPERYRTRLEDDGPRHAIGALMLGDAIDEEADGQPGEDAEDDDRRGVDDEDGVSLPAALIVGEDADVVVTVSVGGFLDAWVDFDNEDGFDHPAEQIFASQWLDPGPNALNFSVPAGAQIDPSGRTYARFRVSSAGGLLPTGEAADGEVEDYRVEIDARPTAVAQATPESIGYGQELRLDGSLSQANDTADSIVSHEWDVDGDGQFDDGASPTMVFRYDELTSMGLSVGLHTVTLRVTNADSGLTDTDSVTFIMLPGPVELDLRDQYPDGGTYRMRLEGTDLVVSRDEGGEPLRIPFALVSELTIIGTGNSEQLRVEFGGGHPVPPGGLHFAGNGTGDDDLLALEGGAFEVMQHTFTAPGSGRLDLDFGRTITYSGLEPIDTTGSTADNLVLNLPPTAGVFGPTRNPPPGVDWVQIPTDQRAVGRSSGVKFRYENVDTSQFGVSYWGLTLDAEDDVLTPWGFDTGIGLNGRDDMSVAENRIDAADLLADGAGSDFGLGMGRWQISNIGFDTDGDWVPNRYVDARLTMWVTDLSGTPLPLISSSEVPGLLGDIGVVHKVQGDFEATFRMDAYVDGQWYPVIDMYDTDITTTPFADQGAITTFHAGFWFDSAEAFLEDFGTADDGFCQLRSSHAVFETHEFANPAQSLSINANGDQSVWIGLMDDGFAPTELNFGGTNSDTYRLAASEVLPDRAAVTFGGNITFQMDDQSDTIGSLHTVNSNVKLELGAGTLTTGGNDRSTTFAGKISGTGGLIKQGAGTFTLTADNIYEGATDVTAGTLVTTTDTALGTAAGGTTVADGATLAVEGPLETAEPLTIGGDGDGGAGALRSTGGDNRLTGRITLSSPATIRVADGSLTLSGTVDTTGDAHLLRFDSGSDVGAVSEIQGAITGGGGLTKTGAAQLNLGGANDYSGLTTVVEGHLVVCQGSSLGDTTAGTIVEDGASLTLEDDSEEPISVRGVGCVPPGALIGNGGVELSGNLTLDGDTQIGLGDENPGALLISGNITDGAAGHGISVFSPFMDRVLTLSGTNTYGGDTTMLNAGVLRLAAAAAIPDTSHVRLQTAAVELDLGGLDVTIGALSGAAGSRVMLGAGTLTTGGAGTDTTFSGIIYGSGGLTKEGTGAFTLDGDSFYSGPTIVNAGGLLVNGTLWATNSMAVNGTVLGGDGTINPAAPVTVTGAGSAVAPGVPIGVLRTGSVQFDAAAAFHVDLAGTVPGDEHDQLDVTGTVDLGGAALTGNVAFAPMAGDVLTIIDNDGTDPVVGRFDDWDNGDPVTIDGVVFIIRYDGGDGNDVVLQVPNSPPTDINLFPNTVQENLPIGTLVGIFSTVDPDNPNDLHEYDLLPEAVRPDNAFFEIEGDRLLTDAVFDFEAKSSYTIEVRSTDGGGSPFDKVFVIDVLDVLECDFGDAPAPFPTLAQENGAFHLIVPGVHLGAGVDSEANGQHSPNADADDTSDGNDDEDGVTMPTEVTRDQDVVFTVEASTPGVIDAWIDLNGDGDWEENREHIFNGVSVPAGPWGLPYTIPGNAEYGLQAVRFRFTTNTTLDLDYTGFATDGEVEDYVVRIIPLAPAQPESSVLARYTFYNGSLFDGNDPAANAADDAAIAPDKTALLPGRTATFANYTSYSDGINGIMIDVAGLADPETLGADDFQFHQGNGDDAAAWAAVTTEPNVTVRPNAGANDSDRVTITWPDGAVVNQWLQVTVLANEHTGLQEPDVFYFGNAVGETGNASGDARVNAVDVLLARNNPRSLVAAAAVDLPYDHNRDGRVNATDLLLARNHQTSLLDALKLIRVSALKGEVETAGDGTASSSLALWLDELPEDGRPERSARDDVLLEEALNQLLAY